MVTEENNPSPPASPYPLPTERAVIELGEVVTSKCPNSSRRAAPCASPRETETKRGRDARAPRIASRLEPDTLHQFCVACVGAQAVEQRIDLEKQQPARTLLEGLLQPLKGLVDFT